VLDGGRLVEERRRGDNGDNDDQPIAKDAGTLFREAYFNRKVNKTNVKKDVEIII
jgi:hypothetical protein